MSNRLDPTLAFPALTDSLLANLDVALGDHLHWLDGYLARAKESDLLRDVAQQASTSTSAASTSTSAARSPPSTTTTTDDTTSNTLTTTSKAADHRSPSRWGNLLKSPVRKRVKETHRYSHSSSVARDGSAATTVLPAHKQQQQQQVQNDDDMRPASPTPSPPRPVSSLSYASAQDKHKQVFAAQPVRAAPASLQQPIQQQQQHSSIFQARSSPKQQSQAPWNTNNNGSLSRSPGKKGGLKSITAALFSGHSPRKAKDQQQQQQQREQQERGERDGEDDFDKENFAGGSNASAKLASIPPPSAAAKAIAASQQASPSKLRAPAQGSPRNNNNVTVLHASARAPVPRSPLQSSTTRAQKQFSASAPGSPSPSGLKSTVGYQSPLTRSQQQQRKAAVTTNEKPASPSPTPRPASRMLRSPGAGLSNFGSPRQATTAAVAAGGGSTTTPPVRVVDDVFTLPSSPAGIEQEVNGEEEEPSGEADDDEEIENILLGYTKTPATAMAKKVLRSEVVRQQVADFQSAVSETTKKEKALPAVPPPKSGIPNISNSPSNGPSPPRPARSPARPASAASNPITSKGQTTTATTGSKSPGVNLIQQQLQQQYARNHSPVKRDMSNLASIASVLGSPTKQQQQQQSQASLQPAPKSNAASTSRPPSPAPPVSQVSRMPVPQGSSRPASPSNSTNRRAGDDPGSSRPASPTRVSSRIAALAGSPGRDSPKSKATPPVSPKFGLTRSPRLNRTKSADSPADPAPTATKAVSSAAVPSAGTSAAGTPSKLKRPMASPLQSPNSQRSLALSSLRKAVPGFETNPFHSPPASPRLPSTTSVASLHSIPPPSPRLDGVRTFEPAPQHQHQHQLQQQQPTATRISEQLSKQHNDAISALNKTLPPLVSSKPDQPSEKDAPTATKPTGLSPPAKSPLRKMNSQNTLSAVAEAAPMSSQVKLLQPLSREIAQTIDADSDVEVLDQQDEATSAPTPAKDVNKTVMPETTAKKGLDSANATSMFGTQHKDSTVNIAVPPSPLFSSFLSNNKRTSTLSFAGLPGRALGGGMQGGREKSFGLGLGLGKSLGASSARDKLVQLEDAENQGNTASSTANPSRQSFYSALTAGNRKRLSSTIGPASAYDADSQGSTTSKASRTEFANTARASIAAQQVQLPGPSNQPMSQSARFDLLRSRISNIKGSTSYAGPNLGAVRTSIAPQMLAQQKPAPAPAAKSTEDTIVQAPPQEVVVRAPEPPATVATSPTPASKQEGLTTSQSHVSTFASTIASFVPAPAFSASFANLFGGAHKAEAVARKPAPLLPAAPVPAARELPVRTTTPPFSPPPGPRVSGTNELMPMDPPNDTLMSSRPPSRLSVATVPMSNAAESEQSIAGLVDIEDPGLEPIMKLTSDDLDDLTSEVDDAVDVDSGDEADLEQDHPVKQSMAVSSEALLDIDAREHVPAKHGTASIHATNTHTATKHTFKPSRPGKDANETQVRPVSSRPPLPAHRLIESHQRSVHRPPSRAPSVSSLAPSRTSTISIASTASTNPTRSTANTSSLASKKANLSVSTIGKPEIKSLQNAAAAAKKEQVERDRKAAIKEERDQKRAAMQAAKFQEPESQSSSQPEPKRKERDELAVSRTQPVVVINKTKETVQKAKVANTAKQTEAEVVKKRKVDNVEVVVTKAPVQKTTVARPAPGVATATQASSNANHAKALAASAGAVGVAKQAQFSGSARPPLQASTSKAPQQNGKPAASTALLSQHQQAILSASTAFSKSQSSTSSKASVVQQKRIVQAEPEEPEPEPFQLPEIDSEYSDSDEDVQAQKAALRPVWTHSPELRQALAVQARFDPDQLFGEIPTLRMEDVFKNPSTMARLRHRTSSAHWSGPDAISAYEEREYAKRMGFKDDRAPSQP